MTTRPVGGHTESDAVRSAAQGVAVSRDGVHSILDSVDHPIVVLRRDCRLVLFNHAASDAFGLGPSDLGRHVCDIEVLADVKDCDKLCARMIDDEAPWRCEIQTGDRRFVLRIAPYRSSTAVIDGAVLTFTNVTAFRASLEQAIYEREYTKAILNTVAEPLVVLDQDLRVQTANRAFYSAFGASRQEAQNARLQDLGDHEWKNCDLWGSLKAILSDNSELHGREVDREVKSAGRRTLLLDARRLSRDGSATILLAFRDITDRKHAEEALRESEARFRALFESMDEGYCVIEVLFDQENTPVDYRFLEVNPAFERQTGIKHAKGRLMREIAPDHEHHWFDIYGRIALTGETLRFENPAAALNRYYDVCAFRVGHPELRRVGVVFNDITERKRAEALIHESQKALLEADKRKDEFLATLAHELRNPLAPIRNGLQVLRMSNDSDPTSAPIYQVMERQVAHLVRLVDDLLELSRITRGKIELKKERVELATILSHAIETAKPLIDRAGHHLSLSLSEPIFVEGDVVRLSQVFANLLNNACKYTENGGTISVDVQRAESTAKVSIRDNGIGIASDMLPRVFEMFTQIDNVLRRSQDGLGIGLNLVRTLLSMHGGTIEAHSEGLGRGSVFTVRLPIVEPNGAPTAITNPPAGNRPVPRCKHRILVVDDNRDAADSLGMLLRFLGADVTVVYDGQSALESLSIVRPSLLFLDIGMPGLDGYDVVRLVRKNPEFANVPLVALTGWGQEEDRRRAREAGFDHHLVKPVEIEALLKLLASLESVSRSP